jgi:transposase InsO family protein
VHAILRRHGCIEPAQSLKHRALERFERAAPNELWQMDFKGDFALRDASRCHPLALIDDHSRFSPCLSACADERTLTVRARLVSTFRRYGLPEAILVDHGAPWGYDPDSPHTGLTVWLMRLGVRVLHGRPYHPQTRGKIERFNRTLKDEVLRLAIPADLPDAQRRFERFRYVYNYQRPHDALGERPPIERYHPSPRHYPETLPAIEYDAGTLVRKVDSSAHISVHAQRFRIGKAFRGYPVQLLRAPDEALYDVMFMHHRIAQIDLRTGRTLKPLRP